MQICCRTLLGKTVTVEVSRRMPIEEGKKVIARKTCLPRESLRLVWAGRTLRGGALGDHGIVHGATLHLEAASHGIA